MAHWLLKTEPESWSWNEQKARGARGEPWSGVRNHQAANNMKAMKKGERCFFYHSGAERRIVGIVEVAGEYRPDPTDATGRFGLVRVKAVADLPEPVTLETAKNDPALAEMTLVKFSRLSVQPVGDREWTHILELGRLKKEP